MPNPLLRLMCAALCVAALASCGKKSAAPPAPQAPAAAAAPAPVAEPAPDTEEPAESAPAAPPVAVGPTAPASPSAPAAGPAAPTRPAASAKRPAPARQAVNTDVLGDCTHAAAAVLGQGAEVLRCGPLNKPDVLEAVAIQRKHQRHGPDQDIFASRVVILRKQQYGWILALDVERQLKNEAGFIAADYIGDGAPLWGYRVKLHETLPDDSRKHFTLEVAGMHDEKDAFATGTEISWDYGVGRYRAYNDDNGDGAFQPERAIALPAGPVRKAPAQAQPPAPAKTPPAAPAQKAT